MGIRLKYVEENKWYHRIFNRISLMQVGSGAMRITDAAEPSVLKPLFVTGFFRSGTSLTTNLISKMGVDIGPQEHLLQSSGTRADLNRDGFFENYLFMDATLYLFEKLNAWGHLPPSPGETEKVEITSEDDRKFARFSICSVHDDRISNRNKIQVLREYSLLSLDRYLKEKFRYPMAIKNPHFSVLSAWLIKKWPGSRFLVCFRNPFDAIASASKITPFLNEAIYCRYYEDLLQLPSEQILFFSYDRLMEDPEKSVSALADQLDLNRNKISDAMGLIDIKQRRFISEKKCDEKTELLYLELTKRSIN